MPIAAANPAAVCRSLHKHGCRYALIGGHAVGVHGYPRATRDTGLLPPELPLPELDTND